MSALDQLSALDEKFVPVLARGFRRSIGLVTRGASASTLEEPVTAATAATALPLEEPRERPPAPRREPSDLRRPDRERLRRAEREVGGEPVSRDRRGLGRLPVGGPGGFRGLVWAGAVLVAAAAISGIAYAVHDSGGHSPSTASASSNPPVTGQSTAPSAFSTLPDPATAPSALPASCPLGTDPSGASHVGPSPGTILAQYVQRRLAVLATCANVAGDVPVVAVVSLSTAQTPEQVAATLGQVTAVAEYVQIPVTGAVPYTLRLSGVDTPGSSQLAGLQAAYSGGAQAFETDANVREGTAGAVSGSAADQQRTDQLATVGLERLEQAQLESGCPCTYAVAVESTLSQLQALATSPGVRLVDGAPYGTEPGGVVGRPILPAEQGQVGRTPAPAVFEVGAP